MKNRKERRHAIKQANTLETSKKVLQKALMSALHKGGFLFSNNGKGAITPVVINATVQQMVVAILAFIFSRTSSHEDTVNLYDYIISVTNRICGMRLKDLPGDGSSSEG